MAKDKNNKKKNSFIKKAASFALVGAMLAGSGTSNLMAGNDPISVSGASTTNNIGGFVVTQGEHNLDGISVDVKNLSSSKPVIGISFSGSKTYVATCIASEARVMQMSTGSSCADEINKSLTPVGSMAEVTDMNSMTKIQTEYMKRALRIWRSYPGIADLLTNKDGAIISLTCSDAVKGYERTCFLTAIKCVFEARGNIGEIKEMWGKMQNGNATKHEYMITPESVACQIASVMRMRNGTGIRQFVTLDCGSAGISICGGEFNNYHGKLSMNTDRYLVGCGGDYIDAGVLEILQERCNEFSSECADAFREHIKDKKHLSNLMSLIKNARSQLINSVSFTIDDKFFYDYPDVDAEIRGYDIKRVLESKGILKNYREMFKDYLNNKLGVVESGTVVAVAGEEGYMSEVRDAIEEVLGKQGWLMDTRSYSDLYLVGGPAYGAACAAACSMSKNGESLTPVQVFNAQEINTASGEFIDGVINSLNGKAARSTR